MQDVNNRETAGGEGLPMETLYMICSIFVQI